MATDLKKKYHVYALGKYQEIKDRIIQIDRQIAELKKKMFQLQKDDGIILNAAEERLIDDPTQPIFWCYC